MAGKFVIQDWEEEGNVKDGKFVKKSDGFNTHLEAHNKLAELKASGKVSPKGIVVLLHNGEIIAT